MLASLVMTPAMAAVLQATQGLKRVVLTTHRRESFGQRLVDSLRVLRHLVERHADVGLLFPVHPNPAVAWPGHSCRPPAHLFHAPSWVTKILLACCSMPGSLYLILAGPKKTLRHLRNPCGACATTPNLPMDRHPTLYPAACARFLRV